MKQSLRRLVKRLTANRRQFGVMMALVVVALFMWGKLVFDGAAPRSASASAKLIKNAAALPPTDTKSALEPATRKVEVALSVESKRDLFRMDLQNFVRIEPTKVIATPNSRPEKSDEARRAEMLSKLTTLQLRSTIMQDDPKALLNGKLFQLGSEPLDGFKITRITQFSVFLKHRDWDEEFELRMYRN